MTVNGREAISNPDGISALPTFGESFHSNLVLVDTEKSNTNLSKGTLALTKR